MSIGKEEISNFILNPLRRVAHEDPMLTPTSKARENDSENNRESKMAAQGLLADSRPALGVGSALDECLWVWAASLSSSSAFSSFQQAHDSGESVCTWRLEMRQLCLSPAGSISLTKWTLHAQIGDNHSLKTKKYKHLVEK